MNWPSDLIHAYQRDDYNAFNRLLFHSQKSFRQSEGLPQLRDEAARDQWLVFMQEDTMADHKRDGKCPHLRNAYQALLTIFEKENSRSWMLKIVLEYSRVLFKESIRANQLDQSFICFRKLVGICQRITHGKEFRIRGLYASLILCIKVMFRLNSLQHYSSILRVVESQYSELPALERFPKSHQVEFRYYQGRHCIYTQELQKAYEHLHFAFHKCPQSSLRNKKVILRYLVPVAAMRGYFPKEELLVKYQMSDLWEVLRSVQLGMIGRYEELLETYHDKFIQYGIHILMEMLKMLAFRNLFKKAVSGATQFPLSKLHMALDIAGTRIDLEEIECVLANLVYKGWIKGYLSPEKKILVLSKLDPFPSISNIPD